jgi:hypothetical protein
MKLLSFDAKEHGGRVGKDDIDVLRIIAVFLGAEPMHEKGKKRATSE